jgi:hypothetical protein
VSTRGSGIDTAPARAYRLMAPWPSECENLPSEEFFTVIAGVCEVDRPDLSERFRRFADEYRTPEEIEERRLAQCDAAFRELARHYPVELSFRVKGNIIASDLARFSSSRSPAASAKNDAIREFIRLSGGKILGAESIRKKLALTIG